MREIKFRAWIRQGEWDEEGENQAYEMCYDLAFEEYEPINDLLASVEHLMQYTGLKDKNGKEIYEGDIFSIPPDKYHNNEERNVVEYSDDVYLLEDHGLHLSYYNEQGEVIGNIYENPELMEVK